MSSYYFMFVSTVVFGNVNTNKPETKYIIYYLNNIYII